MLLLQKTKSFVDEKALEVHKESQFKIFYKHEL